MRLAAQLCALTGALLALLAESAHAASSNRTIDDNSGDSVTGLKPVFQPADKWNYGPDCGCFVQPDKSQVLDGSWHDTTAHLGDSITMSLTFTGKRALFSTRITRSDSHRHRNIRLRHCT
jgi:hypothetical protein